jgi:uncharacterized protein (DUF983 family)
MEQARDILRAMKNGARCTCPRCGKGQLFRAYLKVADTCPACGEALHHQRTDDAPPWAVMLIVCHIVVAGVLIMEKAWSPATWVHIAIWFPVTIGLCLALLPVVKGFFVGLQWATRMHGFGNGPDPADPQPAPVAARPL